ncbi:MAG: ATP-dependent DNA ligase, partial [Smithellaceae bacterium]|nr:ATP-dependent DNA ligase [Smithellaceae bacterium]
SADIVDCARVALVIHDLLLQLGLEGYVKASGKKGLHIYVPLNHPDVSFGGTKKFSKTVAEVIQRTYPERVTAKMAKEQRRGKVFINWAQNDASKTMICVYSLRAEKRPYVSVPLSWSEVGLAFRKGDPEGLRFLPAEALNRVDKKGDLFGGLLHKGQKLPYL